MSTPVARLVSRAVFPVALMISATHLLNAEQGPGDGFTAGIISALGLTLQYEVFTYTEMRRKMPRLNFEKILLLGVAVALFATILPLVFSGSVLGLARWSVHLPLLGEIVFKRSTLFDIGIYLVVFGGSMIALEGFRRADQ